MFNRIVENCSFYGKVGGHSIMENATAITLFYCQVYLLQSHQCQFVLLANGNMQFQISYY